MFLKQEVEQITFNNSDWDSISLFLQTHSPTLLSISSCYSRILVGYKLWFWGVFFLFDYRIIFESISSVALTSKYSDDYILKGTYLVLSNYFSSLFSNFDGNTLLLKL